MLGLKMDQEVLGELVRLKVPSVWKTMSDNGVTWTLVVSRWFICLYIDVLPVEVRVWLHSRKCSSSLNYEDVCPFSFLKYLFADLKKNSNSCWIFQNWESNFNFALSCTPRRSCPCLQKPLLTWGKVQTAMFGIPSASSTVPQWGTFLDMRHVPISAAEFIVIQNKSMIVVAMVGRLSIQKKRCNI